MDLINKNKKALLITVITLILLVSMVSPTFLAKPKKETEPKVVNGYDWDKSSIEVTGDCFDDPDLEAVFYITNTGDPGDGDMDGPTHYYVYINDMLEDTIEFQLNGGEMLTVTINANCDDTIRLEADQRPGHPGNSHPRFTISFEDCECGEID